jgi:hypothetical protein
VHAGEEEAEQRRLEREREDQILREQTEELARREAAAEEERLAAEAQREGSSSCSPRKQRSIVWLRWLVMKGTSGGGTPSCGS